jgi:WD40 repeat protein
MRHRAAVWSATFSSDVRRVITASEDATAQVWAPVNTLPPRFTSLRFEDGAVLGDFRADGLRVALMSETRAKARIFDVATGQPIGAALTHSNTITNVAYSPDGRLVATASFDKSVKFWDAVTGRVEGDPLVHPGRGSGDGRRRS